jgi:hypothetical protein
MENESGGDAQSDGDDRSPSPIRENAQRKKHNTSAGSDFDKG